MFWSFVFSGEHEVLYYDTWIDMYKYDPFYGMNLTNAEKKLVLGGEVAYVVYSHTIVIVTSSLENIFKWMKMNRSLGN
jgi:hypothetical protein